MRNERLVRHFLQQFVENEWSPDADRHQVLAIAAAAVVTIPLFATMFIGLKYLIRPLQAAGWTEATMVGDQMTFCAVSMLVSALIASLEWNALSLSPRDTAILGVLPIADGQFARAKMTALVMFAGAFVLALNAVPSLLHPMLMTAQLPMSVLGLLPLIAAQLVCTGLAGALGFASVLAIREITYLVTGPAVFPRLSAALQSALLFSLLMLLLLVPVRLAGNARWMFVEDSTPTYLTPVSWFASMHALLAGRVLDPLPRPDLPVRLALEERRLTTQFRTARPRFRALAERGALAVVLVSALALAAHLFNARRQNRLHSLAQQGSSALRLPLMDAAAYIVARDPPRRAGFRFLIQTILGCPPHRLFVITSTVIACTVLLVIGPLSTAGYIGGPAPIRTLTVAAQTLALCALLSGFRAAVRTASDSKAGWVFTIADVGTLDRFRNGVRRSGLTIVVATIAVLFPIHLAAWGLFVAAAHAVNGIALGWLMVNFALHEVDRPLVDSLPPADGLNTVGVVLLGGATILVFIMSKMEAVALRDRMSAIVFFAVLLAANAVRFFRQRPRRLETQVLVQG
jgi:hypothetical protein